MEPITIRWETGYMTINPDAFFPTSTARIRKLLRVVALDFEHQDVIRMQLAGACESRAQEILDGRKSLANEAVNHHQKQRTWSRRSRRPSAGSPPFGPASKSIQRGPASWDTLNGYARNGNS